jgi:hypothetical protein
MAISVFLSYPKPFLTRQEEFVGMLEAYLRGRGFLPRTLGVTDYDMDAPLTAIRRLMLESNGLITIAFRRTLVSAALSRPGTDVEGLAESKLENVWYTSPYCQIEPAMAYQIGIPTLILRERGVVEEGLLEKGVVGTYMPEFNLDKPATAYFQSPEWHNLIGKWEGFVRAVVDAKGRPPKLY